ncbi:putative P-loop containing nucleoside triphosphate hydrolase [Rosa chinensis]|uniref:Putative P-loop containing nucleoside triphosphate hydrolase n=1 Tax=Rosa chinensis TaxID=74649 RepID=A0A2P6QTB7_ROSCH|nr:putative P-loop containing nucleoside triphosphate hydrolase [Rosa chinensis]
MNPPLKPPPTHSLRSAPSFPRRPLCLLSLPPHRIPFPLSPPPPPLPLLPLLPQSHANLILSNPCEDVYVQAVHDAHQLLDIMPKIECFVASRKTRLPVRLIVIDSIAALFRSEFGNNPLDLKRRSFLFFEISGI